MKTAIARREFLRQLSLTAGALSGGSVLFDSVMTALLSKAWATTAAPKANSNYVHFSFFGAPPRWLFDLPLTPNQAGDNFTAGAFGTLYSGSPLRAEYVAVPVSVGGVTLNLPPVWTMNLPSQTFTDVLQNTLFVRGMDMQINNHVISNGRQVAPIVGGYSLTGVTGDKSTAPIPGIGGTAAAADAFRSMKGLSPSTVNYATSASQNPAITLLAPFKNFLKSSPMGTANKMALQQQALGQFEKYATGIGMTSSSIAQTYDNVVTLMEGETYTRVTGQWTAVVGKYQALVDEALRSLSRTGLTDKPVTAPSSTANGFEVTVGVTKMHVSAGFDIRRMIGVSTVAPQMAANFAIAELMLFNNISSSFSLDFPPLQKVDIGVGPVANPTHDGHNTGALTSIMINTYFYRAFLSCLTEFVNTLKANHLFDDTVVHIANEFSRSPRQDGSGSDHAFMGSGCSLISGKIAKPTVIGNILTNSGINGYPGTWGVAAPFPLDIFDRAIQPNDVALLISSMLNVSNIVTNGMTLMNQTDGGKYTARIPTGYSKGANNV